MSRNRQALRGGNYAEIARRFCQPVEEPFPSCLRLLLGESLEHHRNLKDVAWPKANLFSPMQIEQGIGIEFDDFTDQASISSVRARFDRHSDQTKKFGQRVGAKC